MTRAGARAVTGRARRAVALGASLLALGGAAWPGAALGAQERSVPLARALELEGNGKGRDAVPFFRQALLDPAAGDDGRTAAILGLERVWDELGQRDSIVPVVTAALRARPADPTLRAVQLRALVHLQRDAEARAAFVAWRRAVPTDATPFREYARLLLQAGRTAAADTLLRDAVGALRGPRGTRAIALELAQLHAALGAWGRAGASWREALETMPYVEQAAVFTLLQTPAASRDSVASALLAPPAELAPRRAAASLLMAWRRPREAWEAVAALAPDDSARATWRDMAERLEGAEAWPVARAAWTRVLEAERDPAAARRASAAALAAGDAAGALALLDDGARLPAPAAMPPAQSAAGARSVPRAPSDEAPGYALAEGALLRVRALAALTRMDEAERTAQAVAPRLDPTDRARLADALADGWIAAGDVSRARAALALAAAREDAPVAGWLALYAGDLKRARTLLRRPPDDASPARTELAMTALAVVARTRADSAPAVGAAFLSAARGDTARAAAQFVEAAQALPEAASLLVASAARLHAARRDAAAALPLWERIATQYAGSPEAPEAELAWARLLRARGDVAGARARLEHLIITYPESALVPLARGELEALRG